MEKKRRDVGKFRHRAAIHNPPKTDDGGGGNVVPSFDGTTLVAEVWSDVTPVGAREQYWSQQLVENVTHSVKIRFRDDVSDGMWVMWGTVRLYIITAVDPTNLKEFLFLACREGGPK